MGPRPNRPLVDELPALGVRELHALVQRSGRDLPGLATFITLEPRPASTLLPQSRAVFILARSAKAGGGPCTAWADSLPVAAASASRTRVRLMAGGTQPLLERMAERADEFARKRGPKGPRYRACLRRYRRVEVQASEWIEKWARRWEPCLREEGLDSPLDLGGFTRLVTP